MPKTDRFRFWLCHSGVHGRSFKLKTRKFAVCVVFLISAGESFNMTDDGWRWKGCKIGSFSRKVSVTFGDWYGRTRIELSQNVTPFLKSTVCNNSNPGLKSETCTKSTIWEPHFALSQNTELISSGAPKERLQSEISVRRSKYCLEISISWGRPKISWWSFH